MTSNPYKLVWGAFCTLLAELERDAKEEGLTVNHEKYYYQIEGMVKLRNLFIRMYNDRT